MNPTTDDQQIQQVRVRASMFQLQVAHHGAVAAEHNG